MFCGRPVARVRRHPCSAASVRVQGRNGLVFEGVPVDGSVRLGDERAADDLQACLWSFELERDHARTEARVESCRSETIDRQDSVHGKRPPKAVAFAQRSSDSAHGLARVLAIVG